MASYWIGEGGPAEGRIDVVIRERWTPPCLVIKWCEDYSNLVGHYMDRDGYWRHYRSPGFSWSEVEYATQDEVEIALAKNKLLEAGEPGVTWRAKPVEMLRPIEGDRWPRGRVDAERDLHTFAEDHQIDPDRLVDGVVGDRWVTFGSASGPDEADSDYFWEMLERVTGRKFSAEHRKGVRFSCAC